MRIPQRRARRGEERTAVELGGRRQPGSGSQYHSKGDVKSEHLLVEEKMTAAKSYSVKLADLEKLRRQAALEDRVPVFKVTIGERAIAIIDWSLFVELHRAFDQQ